MRVGQMQARPVSTLICVPAGPNVYIPSENKQTPPKNWGPHYQTSKEKQEDWEPVPSALVIWDTS